MNRKNDFMVRLCVGGEMLDEKVAIHQDRKALANGVFLARDLVLSPLINYIRWSLPTAAWL